MAFKVENVNAPSIISEMYLNAEFADVTFAFKENGSTQLVPAHKSILATRSPVFRAMFYGQLKEQEIVEIVDLPAETFKEFMQIFYLSEVTLTMTNIEGMIYLADKYDMLNCLNKCVTFLEKQLTDENMFCFYQLAISLNNQKIKEICEYKIKYSLANELHSEAFLRCEQKVLKNILQMDELMCEETDIFEACIKWAQTSCRENGLNEKDSMNWKKQLGECFYMIRYGGMKSEEISTLMMNDSYADMFSRDELLELLRAGTVNNGELKMFNQKPRSTLSFEGNDNPQMVWSNKNEYDWDCSAKDDLEPFDFSTNIPVLLGKICFSRFHTHHQDVMSFNIILMENSDISFTSTSKVLLTQRFSFVRGSDGEPLQLIRPILIQPNKGYSIRFELVEEGHEAFFDGFPLQQDDCILREGAIITFANTQSKSYTCISALYFKQLRG